jgi:hypothetical protein
LSGPSKRRRAVAIIALVLAALAGSAILLSKRSAPKMRVVALPEIRDGAVRLRVAHAVNPRFPRLDDTQLKQLLAAAVGATKLHFRVKVDYEGDPAQVSVEELFRLIPARVSKFHRETAQAVRSGPIERDRLIESYRQTILEESAPLADVVAYMGLLGVDSTGPTNSRLVAEALADHHINLFRLLRDVPADDGKPLVDGSWFNEWSLWESLGYGDLPFDLVITNQPILSLEYYGTPVHTALRGGMTLGTTLYSKRARYGSAVVWSTFAFTATQPAFVQLRGGALNSSTEAAEVIAKAGLRPLQTR